MITPRPVWSTLPLEVPPLTGPLAKVIIHHSYVPDIAAEAGVEAEKSALRTIDRFHRVERGWKGFAYNFAVFQSGNLYEGRGWLRLGAHTEGQNSKSHGICWIMDGEKHAPTAVSIASVQQLIAHGLELSAVAVNYSVHPHDEFKNKVCPGERVKEILFELSAVTPGPARILKEGDTGEDVKRLQVALRMKRAFQTGFFGMRTKEAVMKLQAEHHLQVDGIVGKETRAVLPGL